MNICTRYSEKCLIVQKYANKMWDLYFSRCVFFRFPLMKWRLLRFCALGVFFCAARLTSAKSLPPSKSCFSFVTSQVSFKFVFALSRVYTKVQASLYFIRRNLTYFAAEIQALIELAYLISYLSVLFISAIFFLVPVPQKIYYSLGYIFLWRGHIFILFFFFY